MGTQIHKKDMVLIIEENDTEVIINIYKKDDLNNKLQKITLMANPDYPDSVGLVSVKKWREGDNVGHGNNRMSFCAMRREMVE